MELFWRDSCVDFSSDSFLSFLLSIFSFLCFSRCYLFDFLRRFQFFGSLFCFLLKDSSSFLCHFCYSDGFEELFLFYPKGFHLVIVGPFHTLTESHVLSLRGFVHCFPLSS